MIMLGLAGFALTFTGCESAGEAGLEQLVESQGGGDVDLDLNADGGISMQTEDGGMSVDEDGNLVITDADGSVVTGNIDAETGGVAIESEDGSFSSGATTELPDEWPSEIPKPTGLAITTATVIGSDTEQAFTVTGTVAGDGAGFVESFASALVDAGFNEDSTFTSDGTINNVYSNANWTVSVAYYGEQTDNQATISVFTNS